MSAIVEFENVTKTYDGAREIVKNLSLDVESGEFLTMLGPSGSGKTTCLMMLAGFEAPTTGEIRLEGRALSKLPPYRRDIGVVFQNYALFPNMTIGENIAFPLAVRKADKQDVKRRVDRALDMVQLGGYADRRITQISGGQQQRVALARALVFDPKLVLMDEPLGALDRQLREHMQLEIRAIHENLGITIVYVTHDQGEALTMSDRIAVFNNGRIQQLAAPNALYEKPESAFVAGFIGENNAIRGDIVKLSEEDCWVAIDGVGTIRARTGDVNGQSRHVVATIRPEKVKVLERNAPDADENGLAATLQEAVYLGDHIKLILRLADKQILVAKVEAGQAANIGRDLSVSWDAKDCIAFYNKP